MTRLLFFSICITLLTSCASSHKKRTLQGIKHSDINNWSMTGKFALSNGKENGSGRITYTVNDRTIYAKFKAPLGQGSWEIKENGNSAELSSTEHNPVYGNNAQTLISNELGWDFPWNSLRYWLKGYQMNSIMKPHNHSIDEINDGLWTISYSKWEQTSLGLLPRKIKASKPPYTIKLVIYKWEVGQ